MKNKNKFGHEERYAAGMEEIKNYCVCGHRANILVWVESQICRWCHRMVKNQTKAHFIYKLRKLMEEEEKYYECSDCGKVFESKSEEACPYCLSGDVLEYEEDEEKTLEGEDNDI